MASNKISKLEPYDIRKIWKKEEKDFTPWLFDNMEILSDRLDLELSAAQKRAALEKLKQAGLTSKDFGNKWREIWHWYKTH